MTELLLDIAGTWFRAFALVLSAYLVQHHIVSGEQGDRLTSELVKHLTLVAPAALALAWGTAKNVWQKRAVLTALMMPHGSTENELKTVIKAGATPTVFTAPDTAPGVPLPPTSKEISP